MKSRLSLSLSILLVVFLPSQLLAHGGEDHSHADEPKPQAIAPTVSGDRWEMRSPEVELMGIIKDGKLTLYADRFASNEAILNAKIELDINNQVLQTKAEADGSYSATADWLKTPGKYDIVASVETTDLQDLLVGSLEITAPKPDTHSHTWLGYGKWIAGAAAVLIMFGLLILALRRRKRTALLALPLLPGLLTGLLLSVQPVPSYAHEGEDHSAPAPKTGTATAASAPVATGNTPQRQPDGSLFIPKPVQRLLGIRHIVGKTSTLARTQELDGRVIADPNYSGRVQPSQAGRLTAPNGGFPTLGMAVRKGQILAYIEPSASNIEKGNQQAQLAELTSNLTLAESRAQRLAQLVGSFPQKDIDAAQAEVTSLRARKVAVAASLYQREALHAPVSGVISQANGVAGQVVEAREVIFEVVDPTHLRVEAIAYDSSLNGQVTGAVGVTTDQKSLKLSFIGQSHQLREQALPLQFAIKTSTPSLNVGQTLKVLVAMRQTISGIPVPRDSVLKNNRGEPMLWEHTAAEYFVPKSVKVQAVDADTFAVVEGLSDGARVVTQGAAVLSQIR